ncbi:MAG: cytochrome c3 family protein [Deltaproteobacteria bacterium]|nr:cytochrome c3 family protein [Deltaproteobacteria bacterium]
MNDDKKFIFKINNNIIYSFLLYIFIIVFGSGYLFADIIDGNVSCSDIIIIKAQAEEYVPKMPEVSFLHDLHTEKLETKDDCKICHNKKNNFFIFGFKELTGKSKYMDLYHNNCTGCHNKISGKKRGPINGECRLCHKKKKNFVSSRQPVSFYDSLHDIHETSPFIKASEAYGNNCGTCHHSYDNTLNKTVYIEGEESNCIECHDEQEVFNKNSLAYVSHSACINCHIDLLKREVKTAPITCKGCHQSNSE